MSAPFTLGLDLGQTTDYTALTVLQSHPSAPKRPGDRGGPAHALRHVERPPLGTPYTAIAERVRELQRTAPLTPFNTTVVVDITGVGLPVFEMLKGAGVAGLVGISIHGGDAVTRDGRVYRVPKRDLVSTAKVLLQTGRLKFAEGMELGPVLRRELQAFKVKINIATGHDTYEAWREGDHDDLVLSLAMACWHAERPRHAHRSRILPL